MDILIPALASLGVVAVLMFAYSAFSKKDNVSSRIKDLHNENNEQSEYDRIDKSEQKSAMAESTENFLGACGINTKKYDDKLKPALYQAGISNPDATIWYVFWKTIGFAIAIALAIFMFMIDTGTSTLNFAARALGVLCVIAAIWGGDLYLRNAKQKRQKKLVDSFPDALDLILVCVESGLALDAVLSRVCKELATAHPEITAELNRTRIELALLNNREKALQNLGDRTDLPPFRSLVAALLQSEKFGTSLAETLRSLSEDYRNTRVMEAENKAGRLPALMTIPMMLFMLPAFVIIVIAPAILKIMEADPFGTIGG